ncbi:apurinic/apyrimidinic endonuclease family protein [Paenibacillus cymbidii]|uniref:TIM barrel protein n=1 Tax=Paenibacillus cymbidii TaxID=1639034 RepID=UPI001080FD39|nr:TIM barrel protein [Paenibacillus cymbidii]
MLLSPCLNTVFTANPGLSFAERIGKLGRMGFRAYEFWGWYDHRDELDALREAQDEAGLQLSCFLTKSGMLLMDPSGHAEFVEELRRSINVAARLACKRLLSRRA